MDFLSSFRRVHKQHEQKLKKTGAVKRFRLWVFEGRDGPVYYRSEAAKVLMQENYKPIYSIMVYPHTKQDYKTLTFLT